MNCINVQEQETWLKDQKMQGQPYGSDNAPKHYIQFYAPKHLRAVEAFAHNLTDLYFPSNKALLSITDWALYQPYEMRLFDCVRSIHGEKRWLIDAPGHLFSTSEKDDLIGLFSLSVAFEWTSYIYFPDARVTLLNWEGVIFDFWTDDSKQLIAVSELLKSFSLEHTKDKAKAR
jgi:hypothetical protein